MSFDDPRPGEGGALWGDNPSVSTEAELEARRFDRPASGAARLRAVAGGAWENLTPFWVARQFENPWLQDAALGSTAREYRLSQYLDVETLNERYGIEGALSFDQPTTARWAADRHERTRRALFREDVIRRAGDAGEGGPIGDFFTGLAVGVVDPVNFVFPFGRINALRSMAAPALASEALVPRMLAHGGVGTIEGAVFSAAFEPAFLGLSALDRQGLDDAAAFEYGLQDSLINIIAGAGVSGVLNSVGGAFAAPSPEVTRERRSLPDTVRQASPEQRAYAAAEAVQAMGENRPVEAARVFDEPGVQAGVTGEERVREVERPAQPSTPADAAAVRARLETGRDEAVARLQADLEPRFGDDAPLMARAIADGFASIGAHYGETASEVMQGIGLRVTNETGPAAAQEPATARRARPTTPPTREELQDLTRRAVRYANREDAKQRYADAFEDVVEAVERMPDGRKWLARRLEDESDDRRLALYRDVQRALGDSPRYAQDGKKKYLGERTRYAVDADAALRAQEALAEFADELEVFQREFDELRRMDNALPAAISEPIEAIGALIRDLRSRAPEEVIAEQRASRDKLKAFRDQHAARLAEIRSDGINPDGSTAERTLLHWVDQLLAAYDESLSQAHTIESALADADLDPTPHSNLETAIYEFADEAEGTPDEAFANEMTEMIDNLRPPGLGGDEVLLEAQASLARLRRNLDELWDEWQAVYARRAQAAEDAPGSLAEAEGIELRIARVDLQLADLIGAFDGVGMDHGGLRALSRPTGKRRTFMQSPRLSRAARRAQQRELRRADKKVAIAERQAVAFLAAAECIAREGLSDAGGRGASELLAGLALGQAAAIPGGVLVANAVNDQTLQNPRNPEQWLERVRRDARANLDLDAMGFLDSPAGEIENDGRRFFEGQGWYDVESDADWTAPGVNDWTPPADGSAMDVVTAAQANGARVPPAPPSADTAPAANGEDLRAAFAPMIEDLRAAREDLEAEALIEAFEPLMTPAQRRARREARRRREESAS